MPEGKPEENGEKKYRIMISDGVHYQPAILTGKLNDLVTEEKIRKFTVFRLDNYVCHTVRGRRCASLVRLPRMNHACTAHNRKQKPHNSVWEGLGAVVHPDSLIPGSRRRIW